MTSPRLKIVFFCKRRPQGRDLLTRPYGRFFHIPRLLALKGHEVHVLLLSYKGDPSCTKQRDGITWMSESVLPYGPTRYIRRAWEIVKSARPDWVAGFSDIYFGILAERLARRYDLRSAIDAYDNYESYIPWFKPLHRLWRKALLGATVVTAAGPQLAEFLQQLRAGRPVQIVPMAADPDGFEPMDRELCRRRLGLPFCIPLVAYCGSIYRNRGVQLLFDAFDDLRRKDADVRLILSGRKDRGVRLPAYAKWLGYLPDEDVPYLLNAMNVLVVINPLSSLGRYSYPAKLYEALS